MMMNVICYKVKNPVIYNKGTEWEKKVDTFLKGYFCGTEKELETRVAELNAQEIKIEDGMEVDYYFGDKQEEMY